MASDRRDDHKERCREQHDLNGRADRNGTLNLRVLVDHSIVEVFAENGERVLTDLVYPSLDSRGLAILAEGGTATLDVDVYEMRSIWSGR